MLTNQLYYTVDVASCVPREDLVVAMLEISLLLSPDGVHQLVLVEIENLVQAGKVGSQGNELTQVQNTAAEEDSAKKSWIPCTNPLSLKFYYETTLQSVHFLQAKQCDSDNNYKQVILYRGSF